MPLLGAFSFYGGELISLHFIRRGLKSDFGGHLIHHFVVPLSRCGSVTLGGT